MSFYNSQSAVRAVVFVKIELAGKTLRYATEDIMASDTDGIVYFWEGRVASISELSIGFNDLQTTSATVGNLSITLSNGLAYPGGSNLDADIANYFWGAKKVTVFLTQALDRDTMTLQSWRVGPQQTMGPQKVVGGGPSLVVHTHEYALNTDDIIFKGLISFPNCFSNYSDFEVAFSVYDDRYNDQIQLNPNIFEIGGAQTNNRSPFINNTAQGQTAPVIYGDFSKTPVVKAFLTNLSTETVNLGITTVEESVQVLTIADVTAVAAGQTPISDVSQVIVNLKGVTFAFVDNAAGSFELLVNTFQPGDSIFALCKGKTRGTQIASIFGGLSTTLLEHPVEIIYDILNFHLSTPATDINSAAFVAYQTLYPDLKARAYFDQPTSAVTALNSLCFEFGIDLYSFGGQFTVSELTFSSQTIATSYTEDDIESGSYMTQVDPNRLYFNALTVTYDPDGILGSNGRGFQLSHPQKIAYHGYRRDFRYDAIWNHDQYQLTQRFLRLLYEASKPLQLVSFQVPIKAFNELPNNAISFTHHIYNASTLFIRALSREFSVFKTTITAWFLGNITIKNWGQTADVAATSLTNAATLSYAVYHGDCTILQGFNDEIDFTTDAPYVASLTPGKYGTSTLLCAEIQRAMNAVSLSVPVTVSYDVTLGKFTIATNNASVFSIQTTTAKEIFDSNLGFSTTGNLTGANSYTSTLIVALEGENEISEWD